MLHQPYLRETGEHDDRRSKRARQDELQDLDSVDVGKVDVQKHRIWGGICNPLEALSAGVRGKNREEVRQRGAKGIVLLDIVVDQKDFQHENTF